MGRPKFVPPEWTDLAGGRDRWSAWVEGQVQRCCQRAKNWAKKRGRSRTELPGAAEWRAAIVQALVTCGGRGWYSGLPLSLAPPGRNTDWDWPSLDHVDAPNIPTVALETRLVNDMKSIMSNAEFSAMAAHIAHIHGIALQPLPQGWQCVRSFAIEEPIDEPPLPDE